MEEEKNNKGITNIILKLLNAIVVFLLIVCIGVGGYTAINIKNNVLNKKSEKTVQKKKTQTIKYTGIKTIDDNLKRKIDFTSLRKINPFIYGWITIPGTRINHFLTFGETEDFTKAGNNGDRSTASNIFISNRSQSNFSDANTLIRGRLSGFNFLANYQSRNYMNAHKYVFIYLPNGNVYVYRIFAEMELGNNDENKFTEFIKTPYVSDINEYKKSIIRNSRNHSNERTSSGKILTLLNYDLYLPNENNAENNTDKKNITSEYNQIAVFAEKIN